MVPLIAALTWVRSASASGMVPCGMFLANGGLFSIGDAYAAADLVAIGKVVPGATLTLHIVKKIKGNEAKKDVSLTTPQCQGTACGGGFSVLPGVDLLFLLKRLPDGVYDGVSGNGNFSCPTVFELKNGAVKLGGKNVPLKSLRRYLQSKPDPIPVHS